MKLRILIITIFLLVGGIFLYSALNIDDDLATVSVDENLIVTSSDTTDEYEQLNKNILHAGPPKDGIPPIDDPRYETVESISFMNDLDPVFLLEIGEDFYVFPQKILVWHEIVNDHLGDESYAITYCPLTGSAVCYENLEGNTFGTSGNLLNSNLVMYDRLSDSYIPQVLGIAISDTLQGQVIETHPLHWTTWEKITKYYPTALVLSTDTGFIRDYSSDPYGTYLPEDQNSYYFTGPPMFPVLNSNTTYFRNKSVIIGIKEEDKTLAIDPSLVRLHGFYQFSINNKNGVAFYDEQIDSVRVFYAEDFSFNVIDKNIIDQNGNVWTSKGSHKSLQLKSMTYFDVMWFAWYAFYPDTEVIQ